MRVRRRIRGLVPVLAAALVVAGCTDGGGGGASGRGSADGTTTITPGMVNISAKQPAPVTGGTLQFSEYAPTLSLDPARTSATGSTDGIPMAAIYGVLMRYNPNTGNYAPKLAQSLTHNADYSAWTLKLRPGVKFTDGTPLNAAAVVFNLKRMARLAESTAAPLAGLIDHYDTPDAHTVVFHLDKPWTRFPYLLASSGGMIASPTAVRELGKKFATHPVGAGPFMLKSFTPNEQITLVRNPDYWGGKVYLDRVRFTHIGGGQATADRFRSGGVQAGLIRDAQVITSMLEAGTAGYIAIDYGGGWMANKTEGHPTADPRVRRAIAYAINVDQLNQRATKGTGLYSRALFPKTSPWHPDAQAALPSNPDKARQLVAQARKDTGWDGALNIVAVRDQQQQWHAALAMQAQLNAVGFQASVTNVRDINGLIRTVFVDKDYDLAGWALTLWNSSPWHRLHGNLYSTSKRNFAGYADPKMDRLLDALRTASDAQAGSKVMASIQRLWNHDQPFIVTHSSGNYVFWDEQVHGVEPTSQGVVLLDKAFLK